MNAEDLRMFALRRAVAENQHQQQNRQQVQSLTQLYFEGYFI